LQAFREKYGFDEQNYVTWNSDAIVDWILSIEWPRFCNTKLN